MFSLNLLSACMLVIFGFSEELFSYPSLIWSLLFQLWINIPPSWLSGESIKDSIAVTSSLEPRYKSSCRLNNIYEISPSRQIFFSFHCFSIRWYTKYPFESSCSFPDLVTHKINYSVVAFTTGWLFFILHMKTPEKFWHIWRSLCLCILQVVL